MNVESLTQHAEEKLALVKASVMSDSFIIQLTTIAVIYCIAFLLARQVKKPFKFTREKPEQGAHTCTGFYITYFITNARAETARAPHRDSALDPKTGYRAN